MNGQFQLPGVIGGGFTVPPAPPVSGIPETLTYQDAAIWSALKELLPVPTVSAQIRVIAHTDNNGNITYTSQVLSLSGGVMYGGLDTSLIPSIAYLKVILTLTVPIPDSERLAAPGVHFPQLPPGPLGETVFLAVPPIPLFDSASDASLLMPIFGKGVNNTDEILDITLDLFVVVR